MKSEEPRDAAPPNRWGIAAAAFFLQIALGAVYAWSVFRNPLMARFGWSITQVTLTFTICFAMLGLASCAGGVWMHRAGPRVVVITGSVLYGTGMILASFSNIGLWWLYATYGVVAGSGLGFCYIVPISVLVKWFPDRRGMITGIAVSGFGAGALVAAPLAAHLIENPAIGVLNTFAVLGTIYLVVSLTMGWFMREPPVGWKPQGWSATPKHVAQRSASDFTLREAVTGWQWWALWFMLFLNSCVGISLITQEAPLFERLTGSNAAVAAGMVGIASIGNALGRIAWASVSDALTRRRTFATMFLLQAFLFVTLPSLRSVATVTVVAFLILMNYGGGFGTMPAFVADLFGSKHVGSIYGLMATAWSCGGLVGPLIVVKLMSSNESYATGFRLLAGLLLVFTMLPIAISPPRARMKAQAATAD